MNIRLKNQKAKRVLDRKIGKSEDVLRQNYKKIVWSTLDNQKIILVLGAST